MSDTKKILSGAARKPVTTTIQVGIDEATVQLAAKAASKAVVANHPELREDEARISAFNAVALRAVLTRAIDEEKQIPKWVRIPSYCDSMLGGVATRIGRYLIVAQMEDGQWSKPEGYEDVAMTLQSYGIPCVPIRRVNEQFSSTLALGVESIDEVACVVGNLDSVSIEDVVRRCLISIEEKSKETWRALVGSLGLQYGELDTLVFNYFNSEAGVCRN